ncbi:MAG: 3-oxoacyl-ACP reductase [Bacteroidetes bacterium GWF2_38_335]|nr:MAG: 3-oxoacyl-ACP reductase [Bacteroidetes bacterium GWF2_38_335]OFY78323.1 MAG: 3-oxoacyl-ACP reductase [Bacteroidetes bacterium RIFOXYA12_FULL_38_20]HBS87481.1 3-oxoacyl-ACP reductase [Bacteroidales bacterium]
MEISFKNKRVLITGASRGIGKAAALMFAEAGADVVIHYNKNHKGAEQVLGMLKPGRHGMVSFDMEFPEKAEFFFNEVIERFGKIDILVNNAGVINEIDLNEISFAEWEKNWKQTLDINLTAAAHLSFLFGRSMAANGGGKIVNISSRGAFRGEPNAPVYGASKAGMNALGQSMAKALAPKNVFIYTVAPGFVDTEMSVPMLTGPEGDQIRNQSPFGRVARPEEVAHAVLMLAAEGTDFMSGCILDINGASYLRT